MGSINAWWRHGSQKADAYYTDELHQLVREIYADDFAALGYS